MESSRPKRRESTNGARARVIFAVAALLSGCYYRGCACDRRGRGYDDHDRGHDRDRNRDHDRR
jgi:hypothetical protein